MPEDQEPFRHPANKGMTPEDFEPIVRPKGYPLPLGALASIKIAARRLLGRDPAEPKIVLYCRGFRVTIEQGDFAPPDGW